MAPQPGETICDPACGTGGFLLAAHDYVVRHNPNLTRDQRKALKDDTFKGWELVQATARLCAMNLLLHGIGSQEEGEDIEVADALAADPGERFDLVLTNPPFGKKSSTTIVGEEGKVSKERDTVERDDFWTTTSNKQLNFVQHVKTLLRQKGRAAVVVPDNVLFEGGAGETIRRKLLHECDVHTLLRLPTGLFYAQGWPLLRIPALAAFVRPAHQSQRAVLRQKARQRKAVDPKAVDLRLAHQQALHAEDQSPEARRPGRVCRVLQARQAAGPPADLVGGDL